MYIDGFFLFLLRVNRYQPQVACTFLSAKNKYNAVLTKFIASIVLLYLILLCFTAVLGISQVHT